MRAILLVAAACLALSGCDESQPQAALKVPPAPTASKAPQETAAAAVQPAKPVAHHHRRYRAYASYSSNSSYARHSWHERRHGHYSRTDFTQSVLVPYNYISRSSVREIGASREDYFAYRGYSMRERGHARLSRDTIAATMTRERFDPWHGYDIYCPEQ